VLHADPQGTFVFAVLEDHGLDRGMGVLEVLLHGREKVSAAGEGDVEERGVDVLDDVVVQGVLKAGHGCTGPISHRVPVAGVAGKIIHPVEVAVVGQAEAGRAA